ncbi:MAG: HAD family phosphatase [Endomicrobium sp.]|jgi:beta-phosphoglucomutase|nr:HAD family phosphatase [Endomicrobium sp.]
MNKNFDKKFKTASPKASSKNSRRLAVLFDMDGIIVDSMPYHFISWFEVLRKYNVRVAPADIFAMEGAKWDKVIRFAFKREGKPLSEKTARKIFLNRQKLFAKYFKRYIFDGVTDIIKLLKNRGFLIGLVTGSSLEEAKKMLPKEIYSLFDTKVAGDMVKKGKPFPDSYLLAAKKLSLNPRSCFVIENAPYGIRAAKAAGMYCVVITTSLSKEYLSEADKIYNSHAELLKHLMKQPHRRGKF